MAVHAEKYIFESKKKTRDRENKLKKLVTEFSVLNSEDKKLQIYNYSLKIGCLSKEYYTKKFLKEIEDIEELDITKISPNIFDQTLDSSIPDLECSNTENYTFLNL